jgi:hypothetical protein
MVHASETATLECVCARCAYEYVYVVLRALLLPGPVLMLAPLRTLWASTAVVAAAAAAACSETGVDAAVVVATVGADCCCWSSASSEAATSSTGVRGRRLRLGALLMGSKKMTRGLGGGIMPTSMRSRSSIVCEHVSVGLIDVGRVSVAVMV